MSTKRSSYLNHKMLKSITQTKTLIDGKHGVHKLDEQRVHKLDEHGLLKLDEHGILKLSEHGILQLNE